MEDGCENPNSIRGTQQGIRGQSQKLEQNLGARLGDGGREEEEHER